MKNLNRYFLSLTKSILVFLAIMSAAPCFASPDGLVGWYHGSFGYESALEESRKNETPVILFFYIDSDEYCQKLGTDYFAAYDVYSYLEDIPKVDINLKGNEFEIEVAKKYNIGEGATLLLIFPFATTDPVQTSPFLDDRDMTPLEFAANLKNIFSLTYNKLGYSFFENHEYDKAVNYYELSIKYDPNRSYSYFALGSVFHAMAIQKKDMTFAEKAEESYKKAIKLDRECEECKKELEKLYENIKKLGG